MGPERAGSGADVIGDECGITADAVDEVRVAIVLEALSADVGPGERHDAATLADLTACVEDRETEPVVGSSTGCACR